ncbi:MAG: rod shape-determining protein MreC [Neisseria sp.]|nr:rod shape-determining protein MreC [Neisseria sp.]
MTQESLHFTDRGLKPLTKFILLSSCALALLIADMRLSAMQRARSSILTVLAPLQQLLQKPVDAFADGREFITHQSALVSYNKKLAADNAVLNAQLAQTQTLERENAQLKQLLQLSSGSLNHVAAARVVATGGDLSERLTIDKGSADGVQAGQAVVDAQGLIGQVTAVSTHYAQVTLVRYQNSVIPVMVARTGFRSLIYGDAHGTDLRYFPTDADLRVGDVLVTSGIDANYPAGIPVARVQRLETAVGTPYYRTQTVALGGLGAVQHVLVLPLNRPPADTGLPAHNAGGVTP